MVNKNLILAGFLLLIAGVIAWFSCDPGGRMPEELDESILEQEGASSSLGIPSVISLATSDLQVVRTPEGKVRNQQVILWDLENHIEIPWSRGMGTVLVTPRNVVQVNDSGDRLQFTPSFFPQSSDVDVNIEFELKGFFIQRLSMSLFEFFGHGRPIQVAFSSKRVVDFKVVNGAGDSVETSGVINLTSGFYCESIAEIKFKLDSSGEFSAILGKKGQLDGVQIRIVAPGGGEYSWILPTSIRYSKEPVPLLLPEMHSIGVECYGEIENPIELRVTHERENGSLSVLAKADTLVRETIYFSLFPGKYQILGKDSMGMLAQKIVVLAPEENQLRRIVKLDFLKDGLASAPTIAAPPSVIIRPEGTVKFSLNIQDQVAINERLDVHLWQFTPNRQRKDECVIKDLPLTFADGQELLFSFQGRPEIARGMALFGLEVNHSELKQSGLALVEAPYDSECLDFGQITLQKAMSAVLYVNGIRDLSAYRIALAPVSVGVVKKTQLKKYFGEQIVGTNAVSFKGVLPGKYQIAAFREDQLASTGIVEVPALKQGQRYLLSCNLRPPGTVTVTASRDREPLAEYSISSIYPSFWPLDYREEIHDVHASKTTFIPDGVEMVVTAFSHLIAGGRMSPILHIPFQVVSNQELNIDLTSPQGGVISGKVDFDGAEFLYINSVPHNLRRYGFLDAEGHFFLTGYGEGSVRLFLINSDFHRTPIGDYSVVFFKGTLLLDGTVKPEY